MAFYMILIWSMVCDALMLQIFILFLDFERCKVHVCPSSSNWGLLGMLGVLAQVWYLDHDFDMAIGFFTSIFRIWRILKDPDYGVASVS